MLRQSTRRKEFPNLDVKEARQLLSAADLAIKSEKRLKNDTGCQIRLKNGGIVNVFDNGNFNVQGTHADVVKPVLDGSSAPGTDTVGEDHSAYNSDSANQVFVVHGHDEQARDQLELILHKLGLDPFVLANTAGEGLTIIEALEQKIGPNAPGARFGIVLMTPDDVGYSKSDGSERAEPRARQNVVMEMGMLISGVGRKNVAILKKGHLEVPSDAQGILYLPFNDHVKECAPKLVDRLRAAGFDISAEQVTRASS